MLKIQEKDQFATPPRAPQGGDKGDYREFTGDGTSFLRVPGLRALRGLRIGNVPMPLTVTETYPTDLTDDLRNQEEATLDLVRLDEMEDGTPVLVRSVKSNHGIWQIGVRFYVDGDWDEPGPGKDAASGTAPTAQGQVGKSEAGTKGVPGTK